ncbi:LysM peptidoglycan-binding domain-containing protein [bacterium]|nr:LysM peptidoglycan-binding domain-containing protein [bacterium]
MELKNNVAAAYPTLARRLEASMQAAYGPAIQPVAPQGLGQDAWVPTTLPTHLNTRMQDMIQRLHTLLHETKTPPPAPTKPPAQPPAQPSAPATYTVQKGDSLSKIAKQLLGDGARWPELYEANRATLSNPDRIFPGQQLIVPGAKAPNTTQPPAPSGPAPAAPPRSGSGSLATLGIPLSDEEIAKALNVPLENIKANLPYVVDALKEHGITSEDAVISVLATIAVETGNFKPITEYASGDAYEGRRDLGNTQRGDGRRYKGRGYIQITGRYNYEKYGKQLGVDLVGNPSLALDPKIAAQILARYFKDRNIAAKAERGDVEGVRRAVNGGTNGLARFESAVNKLEAYA